MLHPKNLRIADFSYSLPEDRIAQFPLANRDASKLLVYRNQHISSDHFANLVHHLPEHSLVVFNNTRVIHARLLFHRVTGAQIEIFCIDPVSPPEHQQNLSSTRTCTWKCMVGNSKRWKPDETLQLQIIHEKQPILLSAQQVERIDDMSIIRFQWEPAGLHFADVLQLAGLLPLPPYLNRKNTVNDEQAYQTVYARWDGSVAAPTAGLHFTDSVLQSLIQRNILHTEITLHVGAGTFKPVKSENLNGHEMHEEHIVFPIEAIRQLHHQLTHKQPIVAVGTTVTRSLESLYWFGVKLSQNKENPFHLGQWEAYEMPGDEPEAASALEILLTYMEKHQLDEISGSTSILIAPGYTFRLVDILVTNFHQPGNTLLLLVAAFAGPAWKRIYDYALAQDFRLLSYGDSSILYRAS